MNDYEGFGIYSYRLNIFFLSKIQSFYNIIRMFGKIKNVSTIRELFPISSHVTVSVTLRIFKHVHPILRTPTQECRVKIKFKSWEFAFGAFGDVLLAY